MFCEKCGKEIKEGSAFCTSCGAPVQGKPAAAESQPSAPVPVAASQPTGPATVVQPAPPPMAPGAPAFAPLPPPPKKKHTGLIIGIVALVLVIVAIVLVLVLVVFSSDTGQAKKLINRAAQIMTALEGKGTTLGTDLETLLSNIDTTKSAADYETAADKIRGEVKAINRDLDQALTYASEVQKLGGVPDYKEYASIVSDLIRTQKKEMIQLTEYLDYLGQQSFPINVAAITERTNQFVSKMKELGAQVDDLKAKTTKFKDDKNL